MMNKQYFYGNIKCTSELVAFSEIAKQYGKVAVGITKRKNIYVLNELGKPKKITFDEMVDILGVPESTATLIVDSEGNYQIPTQDEEEPSEVDFDAVENSVEKIIESKEDLKTEDPVEESDAKVAISLLKTISEQLDRIVNFLQAFFLE